MIDPALEAAIEEAPDDPGAYLVYGDWLQAAGDPRGELIALQAAQQRDPDDAKLAQRAARYLKDHAAELLGELAAFKPSALAVSWQLGFLRDARLKLPAKALAKALRALVRHPSSRFLQTITIADTPGLAPAELVDVLLAERRPATLADLRIGKAWDTDRDGERLRDVFPRLARSIDVEWRRIADTIAKQRRLDVKYDAKQLPALVKRPDVAVSLDTPQLLVGLRLELEKGRELGLVAAMKRSFTAESLDQFAVALGEQFTANDEPSAMRWGFLAMGVLGDARAATWVADRVAIWSHQRAVQGAELLARIRSGLAIYELFAMASDPRVMRSRRESAAEILQRVARERTLEVDALLDRSVPSAAASERRIQDAITRRLLDHMIDGRRISARELAHYFATPPLVAPLARRVVWAAYAHGDVAATFCLDDDGTPVDAGGDPIALGDDPVGVLHPRELEPARRAEVLGRWREVFAAHRLEPLFPQLDRPVFELREQDHGPKLTRFKLRTVGFDRLRTAFEVEADWAPVRDDSDGGPTTVGWEKLFVRDGAHATALLEGTSAIGVVLLKRGGRALDAAKLHPVTASELLHALERATTRDRPEPVATPDGIQKGSRVRITYGRGRGTTGEVFWLGDRGSGPRCGLRDGDGETHWVDLKYVALVDPASEPPASEPPSREPPAKRAAKPAAPEGLAKGARVRWYKGRHEGTGTVFWIGANKFGDGMRVGVKDDETGETVWTDAASCELET